MKLYTILRRKNTINNLRKLRKQRKVNAKVIADYLNISVPFYYNLEKELRMLTAEHLKGLSDFYNVTIDYLIGRTQNPQGYILEGDKLPKELREIDLEAIELIRDANNSGITNNDIREIIEYQKYKKGIKP